MFITHCLSCRTIDQLPAHLRSNRHCLLNDLPWGNGLNIAYEPVERHAKERSKDIVDSFDTLLFVIAPYKHFGIKTPEADYGKINTMAGLIKYIQEKK